MSRPDMTLSVVGAMHPNGDGSNRLFEIALCVPGEAIELLPEPKNKHDASAVAVVSARGIQIGYLSAERCGWIGAKLRHGEDLRAVFQSKVKGGALIRVSFSGEDPILPEPAEKAPVCEDEPDDTFYPDEIPPDDI